MKILSIGQLPKEVGGHYTTGIARVVHELSKQHYENAETYLYATNIDDAHAKDLSKYPYQYMGYKVNPAGLLLDWITHPIKTLKRFLYYRNKCHNNPIRFDFMRYNMKQAIRTVQPDLIHMHGDGMSSLYYANEISKIPILLTLHGVFWDGDETNIITKDRYYNTVCLADYFTGLNQECKRRMHLLKIPESKISLIPNGVDTDKFYYSENERKLLRQEKNIPNCRVVFITVGSVIDRKGQFQSIKILESLEINYEYWIIGSGANVDKIKSYSEEHNLTDRIKLIGYVKDVDLYKYLSAADIYLHASDMEGQALSEIEAHATGLKVIVNKKIANTVVGDVNKDKDIYFVLDYDNPSFDTLKNWLNKPYDRHSRTNFSWNVIAQKYESLYLSLTEK